MKPSDVWVQASPNRRMQLESTIPTRRSLIQRLHDADDQESWRQFFETYWKLIYCFAIKLGCTDAEAEEVVQETIISVSRKMPRFKYEPRVCSFKGWLMHVTNWRVIDQLRKRNHRLVPHGSSADQIPGNSSVSDLAASVDPELEAIWKEEWQRNIVDAAMERVKGQAKAQQYQIFYLLMVKRETVPKVSEMLGVSRAQIYLAKHRVGALVKREVARLEKQLL
jgi:RNA polymerase sigma factor (sigma-70 family)